MKNPKYQVLILYAATFLGAILNFIASKINTDHLAIAEYGDVTYVQTVIQLVSWVVLFGWFMSGSRLLALSDNKEKSARIRGAVVLCLVVSSLLLVLISFSIGLAHWSKGGIMTLFFCSLPVCIYPLLTNYMNTTAQGDNFIGRLALARALPVTCYLVLAILIYPRIEVSSNTVLLMHWGTCSLVLIAIIISTRPRFTNLKPVFQELRKENREYGIELYYGSLVMVATNYLAGVTLGWMNDDNTLVGFYSLALSLSQPLSYLPGIVGTTYFKRFVHEDRIPSKVLKITLLISLVSFIGFLILVKPVVCLYKESYAPVALYAAPLAFGFCIHGIGDMINRYLGSHGEGRSIRNCSFACGAVKITGSFLFVYLWDINGAILTIVLSSVVYALSLLVSYRRYIRSN